MTSFSPREGYLTAKARSKFIAWAIERKLLPEGAATMPAIAGLTAPADRSQPIQFWQLFSVLGERTVIQVVTAFYDRVFAESADAWLRESFARISDKRHHIMTQAAMWVDAFGGGAVYHGADQRLHFHHAYNAREVMNARGAQLWIEHMEGALDDACATPRGALLAAVKGDVEECARVRRAINTFLNYYMHDYAAQFGFQFKSVPGSRHALPFGERNPPLIAAPGAAGGLFVGSPAKQEALKQQGNDAFKGERFEEAVALYTKAMNADPSSDAFVAIRSNRSAALHAIGRYKESLQDADACVSARPDWLKGHWRRALALDSLGSLDAAVRSLEDALKTEPGNDEVQARLAATRARVVARNDAARPEQLESAAEAKAIGNSLFGFGRYEDAAKFYSRALALSAAEPAEERANMLANRAACRQQLQDPHGVVADASAALELFPGHVKALLRRAIAYEGLTKWQPALDDYLAALKLTPGVESALQGIARCRDELRA
jgi:stress-induced-phosphoprotein 1